MTVYFLHSWVFGILKQVKLLVSLTGTALGKSRTKGNVSHQSHPEWCPCHSVGSHQTKWFKTRQLRIEKNQNLFYYCYSLLTSRTCAFYTKIGFSVMWVWDSLSAWCRTACCKWSICRVIQSSNLLLCFC